MVRVFPEAISRVNMLTQIVVCEYRAVNTIQNIIRGVGICPPPPCVILSALKIPSYKRSGFFPLNPNTPPTIPLSKCENLMRVCVCVCVVCSNTALDVICIFYIANNVQSSLVYTVK